MLFAGRFKGPEGLDGTTSQPARPAGRQPVIGLALGGGAARGWAHIGILQVLERAGVHPTVVAGTSIGAVVGGCWAAGKLAKLDEFARGITKRRMFSLMDFTLQGSGLINGARLKKEMDLHFGDLSIEALPVRFAAVATELRNGHEVWLTRGSLAEAMRASYALPGVFVPLKLGGRWLTDGALVNPVPVSVARALGADLVIAVNLHADTFGRSSVVHDHGADAEHVAVGASPAPRDTGLLGQVMDAAHALWPAQPEPTLSAADTAPPGIATVMMDAFNITQDRIARSRLAGDPPDVMISPRLGRLGLSDFHKASDAIAAGVLAAERALDDILEARDALVD
jgi:NTE family protein